MKKRIIAFVIFSFILIFFITFASAGIFSNIFPKSTITGEVIIGSGCIDTDGGDNRYIKGEINPPSTHIDRCYILGTGPATSCNGSTCTLEEYYCVDINSDGIKETYNSFISNTPCPYGCSDGACLLNPPTPICKESYVIYPGNILEVFERTVKIEFMDSTRVKMNVAGEITSSLYKGESEELDDGKIIMVDNINYVNKSLGNSSVAFTMLLNSSCPSGNYCGDNICNNIETSVTCPADCQPVYSCTDSDGINYTIKGNTVWYHDYRSTGYQDYCDDSFLYEFYCDGSYYSSKKYDCASENKVCLNGACILASQVPSCTETDGGKNYYVKGSNSNAEVTNITDGCVAGTQKVREYYCGEDEGIYSEDYYCSDGCSNGACNLTPATTETYYPSPFIVNGVADVAIIYGTQPGISQLELVQANNIQEDLRKRLNGTLGDTLVKDSETDLVKYHNWIVVGTPCYNSAIWKSLGLSDCNLVESTLKIAPGQAALKGIQGSNGKLIFLVVGYTTEDLTKAVQYLLTKSVSTSKSYVMGVANPNESYIGSNCTDSDGGVRYNVKGEVVWDNMDGGRSTLIDHCINEEILNESYCSYEWGYTLTRDCGMEGKVCKDGACVEEDAQGGPSSEQLTCSNAGGTWKTFPNGCADSCDFVRNSKNVACTQVITQGCDCGLDKCWTGTKCEFNNQSAGILTCSSGCTLNERCYTFGYRKSGTYCAETNSFIPQLGNEAPCENNFECRSNLCIDGQCMNQGLMKKFMRWVKSSFGRRG